jgi:hypothetical protein
MKQIQPLTIWKDGISENAIYLKLYISYDDLEYFYYLIYMRKREHNFMLRVITR